MKRKPKDTNLVLKKMNYTNPAVISKTQNKHTDNEPPKQRTAVQKTQAKQENTNPDGETIVFFKKTPLAFHLERQSNPKDFERMVFVIKACSKESPGLNVILVEQTKNGSRLVSTDGRRLHVAEISQKVKSGGYKAFASKDAVFLADSNVDFALPNWERVISTEIVERGFLDLQKTGFGKKRKETERLTLVYNSLFSQTGESVNLFYLRDLPKKQWIVYSQNQKGKAIVLKEKEDGDSVFAVIMPLPQREEYTAVAA